MGAGGRLRAVPRALVAASATDLQRIARIGPVTFLVLGVGVVTGGAFHLALCAHLHSAATARPRALWVHVGNAAVWPLLVSAAVRALFGAGGSRLAVPAVVPIALWTPLALVGLRSLSRRSAEPTASSSPRQD